jgi:hypothetical protein
MQHSVKCQKYPHIVSRTCRRAGGILFSRVSGRDEEMETTLLKSMVPVSLREIALHMQSKHNWPLDWNGGEEKCLEVFSLVLALQRPSPKSQAFPFCKAGMCSSERWGLSE